MAQNTPPPNPLQTLLAIPLLPLAAAAQAIGGVQQQQAQRARERALAAREQAVAAQEQATEARPHSSTAWADSHVQGRDEILRRRRLAEGPLPERGTLGG